MSCSIRNPWKSKVVSRFPWITQKKGYDLRAEAPAPNPIQAQGTVRPGAYVPIRDIAPGLLSLFCTVASHAGRIPTSTALWKISCRLSGGGVPCDPGQQTGGSVPDRDTFTRSICPFCQFKSKRPVLHLTLTSLVVGC